MDQAIEFMAGICFLVLGMSSLLRPHIWDDWCTSIERRGAQASLSFGCVNLFLGSFIIAFHPVWHGASLILNMVGIIALLKGTMYLLFPTWLPAMIVSLAGNTRSMVRLSGIVLILIACVLLVHARHYTWELFDITDTLS